VRNRLGPERVSERRACRVLGQPRNTQGYQSCRADDERGLLREMRHRARYRNHVWSYDFVTDRTEDGRQLRLLVVIDEYTRECLAIEVGRSFTAQDVMGVLQYLFAFRGTPEHICSDNLAMIPARSSYPR
jgi:transposase InsO family protein